LSGRWRTQSSSKRCVCFFSSHSLLLLLLLVFWPDHWTGIHTVSFTTLPTHVASYTRCQCGVLGARPRTSGCLHFQFQSGKRLRCIVAWLALQLTEQGIEVIVGDIKKHKALAPVFSNATGAYFATPTTTGTESPSQKTAPSRSQGTSTLMLLLLLLLLCDLFGVAPLPLPPGRGHADRVKCVKLFVDMCFEHGVGNAVIMSMCGTGESTFACQSHSLCCPRRRPTRRPPQRCESDPLLTMYCRATALDILLGVPQQTMDSSRQRTTSSSPRLRSTQ